MLSNRSSKYSTNLVWCFINLEKPQMKRSKLVLWFLRAASHGWELSGLPVNVHIPIPCPPWFFIGKKRQLPNIGQNFWKIVRLIGLHSKTYVQQNQCMMWLHSAILSESVADVNLQLCTHWATKVGSFTMKGT
jgi:hypothetical protein